MKRVIVLGAQVPFVRGGAELLNEELVKQINLWGKQRQVVAELVQLPYKWYPETEILSSMLAWRLLNLNESNGQKIDLCICTKYPTYAASHANKALWLVHQHRVLYDLERTRFDQPHLTAKDSAVRDALRASDRELLAEIEPRYTISQTVTDRLQQYSGLGSEVLYPPSKLAPFITSGDYGDYVLCIGRLEVMKRPDLLIRAAKHVPHAKVVIAGTGASEYAHSLAPLIRELGLTDRVQLAGFVEDEKLLELIANCRAVFYSPVDEDYGFATLESFAAYKPVITVDDSGEVGRIVESTGSGWVTSPTPEAIAESLLDCYAKEPAQLRALAEAGQHMSTSITWDRVISNLVESRL
ncbi:glycosyltransferase involved in cell wall biosynthesis [Xanthomonas campestris]|uniref:Glycosyl transferase n=1 Tax=Xanthomonas euroxanthea TaxID=2259622 RepID=A0AA46CAY3_9XANT|nr:glycosyltransferase family 4 protein [Xanthomonas euroxanthea]NIJ92790.1 glycosyltransferase involved in cell wall biosynthesis [Xanthomonas euroxanthea]PPT31689.1 glycosyl transferase [Xanthomonas arboricola]CAE1138933.1 glycosyltransferase family 4 protein [Xanthomonas euroxanthea]SUZ29760.1 glycosyl transferase [Xanthomonas euroxanthea]